MPSLTARQDRTTKLLEQLAKDSPYPKVRKFARKTLGRNRLPMSAVLPMVPGRTIVEKSKNCGVTRQAYYNWLNGEARPSLKQAQLLAKLTGLSAAAIHGAADPAGLA